MNSPEKQIQWICSEMKKTKKCSKCKKRRPISQFGRYVSAKDGLFPQCKKCIQENNRRYYIQNKEKVKKSVRRWRNNNPERVKENKRNERARLKQEMVEAYGGKCSCCGEMAIEFLTLEHREQDGAEHRRQLAKKNGVKRVRCDMIWREARRQGYPDCYTVLCMNCNFALGMFGYCPHQGTD